MTAKTANGLKSHFVTSHEAISAWTDPSAQLRKLNRLIDSGTHPYRAVIKIFMPGLDMWSSFIKRTGLNIDLSASTPSLGCFETIITFCEESGIHPVFLSPLSAPFLSEALMDVHEHILRNRGGNYSDFDRQISISALAKEYYRALESKDAQLKDWMLCEEIDHQCSIFARLREEDGQDEFSGLDVRLMITKEGLLQSLKEGEKYYMRMNSRLSRQTRSARQVLGSIFSDPLKILDVFERAAHSGIKTRKSSAEMTDDLMRTPTLHRRVIAALKPRVRLHYEARLGSFVPLQDRISSIMERWRANADLQGQIRSEASFKNDLNDRLRRIEDYVRLLDERPHELPSFLRLYMNKLRIESLARVGLVPRHVIDQKLEVVLPRSRALILRRSN